MLKVHFTQQHENEATQSHPVLGKAPGQDGTVLGLNLKGECLGGGACFNLRRDIKPLQALLAAVGGQCATYNGGQKLTYRLKSQKVTFYQVWEEWTELISSMQADFSNHSDVISKVVSCHLLH